MCDCHATVDKFANVIMIFDIIAGSSAISKIFDRQCDMISRCHPWTSLTHRQVSTQSTVLSRMHLRESLFQFPPFDWVKIDILLDRIWLRHMSGLSFFYSSAVIMFLHLGRISSSGRYLQWISFRTIYIRSTRLWIDTVHWTKKHQGANQDRQTLKKRKRNRKFLYQ